MALKISMRNPRDLKPHPQNPKTHPESQIARLVFSIESFGFMNPILLASDGETILAGEGRWRSAIERKDKEVPCIITPLTGDKAVAYMTADNRIGDPELAPYDPAKLREVLNSLPPDLFTATGFTPQEADALLKRYAAQAGGGFLDSLAGGRTPQEVHQAGAGAGGGEPASGGEDVAYITFLATPEQRQQIKAALTEAGNQWRLSDPTECLLRICAVFQQHGTAKATP